MIAIEERKKFDNFLKDLSVKKIRKIFPDEDSIYDYQYNMMKN